MVVFHTLQHTFLLLPPSPPTMGKRKVIDLTGEPSEPRPPANPCLGECPICLEPMDSMASTDEERVTTTTCLHCFHANCIAKWFAIKNSCPCCRTRSGSIVIDFGYGHQYHPAWPIHEIRHTPPQPTSEVARIVGRLSQLDQWPQVSV